MVWIQLELLQAVSFLGLFLAILVLAKLANDLLTPYSIDLQLTKRDNLALSVSLTGYFIAVVIIFLGALLGPPKGLAVDLLSVGGYSIGGLLLLNLSRFINDKLILWKFSNIKEIIEDRNTGTGAVQFGSYVASGCIIAGAVHGTGGGPLTALVFFLLAQVLLVAFGVLYNAITAYDVHAEIEKDNVAAGVAFGGGLVALGIVLMRASSGSFVGWGSNLRSFGIDAAIIFVLLPLMRIFFDKVILPGASLDTEISNDKNVGAAFLEAGVMVSFSSVLFFLMA
jgi:uncharacterized membrane protein YjfL (UPF0719 family)